jgi:hypothetical protein
MDGLVDIENEYLSFAPQEYLWVSEISDSSAVDEEEELDFLIDLRLDYSVV